MPTHNDPITTGSVESKNRINKESVYKIKVIKDGPYLVSGKVPLFIQLITPNAEGASWEWKDGAALASEETVALCRCGKSGTAPFCDGTHTKIGFDGTETASRLSFDAQKTVLDGPVLTLEDARPFCAEARFCDAVQPSWDIVARSNEPEMHELLMHQVTRCPSGRLVVRDKQSGETIEPLLPPSIGIVEDPAAKCSGPLWVRGGIALQAEDGQDYETRNRMTLCRCGQSKNKPFCDGSHIETHYQDGIQEGRQQ